MTDNAKTPNGPPARRRSVSTAAAAGLSAVIVTGVFLLGLVILLVACTSGDQPQVFQIGVLLTGEIRAEAFAGLKDGLANLGYVEGQNVVFEVHTDEGDRSRLPGLAAAIVASQPDVIIAGGGVEADALKAATAGGALPVVFLGVSSAADRGLVASLVSSGNNLTGIETNDSKLTAKRLELLTKMLPGLDRVLILNVPSIVPGVRSVAIAEEVAPKLGLEIVIVEVETRADIEQAAAAIPGLQVEALLIVPVAPVMQAEREFLYPVSLSQRLPIMGVNADDIERGATASYAGSRYGMGFQAARLVDKILRGTAPADIPVETPDRLELVINRTLVDRLGLQVPAEFWGLADEIVDVEAP